jgi:meiotically up-regulated gene 157 (Mug157) protein
MVTRRDALRTTATAVAAAAIDPGRAFGDRPSATFPSRRPAPAGRRFTSPAVEATITAVAREIADAELAWLFGNCFPNTLDTTVHFSDRTGVPDTFVITGDIAAMWLRDSSAQVWPYLPLARQDPRLQRLLAGVVRRQARCILIDPYANAFNNGATGSEWASDRTEMKPELHERKWEIDSLCYPVRLAHGYWKATGDASVFDGEWRAAARAIVRTFREQQRKDGDGPYRFERVTARAIDTLPLDGRGNPTRRVGLVHSGFRPSDDACIFPFLVPANHFAVVSLRQLAAIADAATKDAAFAADCHALADEIARALAEHALLEHGRRGSVWAYEIDGFGNALFMDDSNVPSLLSLPYLGCCSPDDPSYRRTRGLVLSNDNPYFFRGKAAEGVGGPHVGLGMIWPLGIIMRALTSRDDSEIRSCLRTLRDTHAGTGFMHESFQQDDPARFTRGWFAWANTLFGELVLKLRAERPRVLREPLPS